MAAEARLARHLALLLASAVLLALIHGSSADHAASAAFFDAPSARFPLKDHWLFAVAGHTAIKWAALAAWVACFARGGAWRRGALYTAALAIAVVLLKRASPISCPWDLHAFGGSRPGAGGCAPAGHPLSGFAFMGLYAALWAREPRAARLVLAAAWVVGLLAGFVQVARGAHFVSHVLWTAWLAWAGAWIFSRGPLSRVGVASG